MMAFYSPSYMLLVLLPALVLTAFAQRRVQSAFAKWSRVANERRLSGLDTAQIIMSHTGLQNIGIGHVAGQLTDHYDPRAKEMRLSESSTQPTVAAMAIVAHELGHAEQDMTGNFMLRTRGALAPAASLGSQVGVLMIILGLLLNAVQLAWLGVLLFAAMVLFTLITLPVEYDASRRAKKHLTELGLVSPWEREGVDAVLDAAALTYVAGAAVAVLNLLYYLSLLRRRS
jgi:Zn-dependent membrane protease YugP